MIQVFLNGDLDAKLVSCIPGFIFKLFSKARVICPQSVSVTLVIKGKHIRGQWHLIILSFLLPLPGTKSENYNVHNTLASERSFSHKSDVRFLFALFVFVYV